jgi:hypothetical protein
VKLLPRELSNGDGMGVATMVTEGVVPVVVAVGDRDTSDVDEREAEEPDCEAEEAEDEDEVDAGVEVLELPLSCRRSIAALGNGGGSRLSKKICPLLSNRLNSEVSYESASNIIACDEAIETKDIKAMSVDNRRSLLFLVETIVGR